jgi:hypothetical protein
MTNDILKDAKWALEISNRATPGYWVEGTYEIWAAIKEPNVYDFIICEMNRDNKTISQDELNGNMELIAESRDLLPKLAIAVIELSEKLKIAEDALDKINIHTHAPDYGSWRGRFHQDAIKDLNRVCREALAKIRGETE